MRADRPISLVTGGGFGIGARLCEALVERGDRVVVTDITFDAALSVAERITKNADDAMAVHCDVTDRASVSKVMQATVEAFGRIDHLFNIAGAWLRPKSVGFQPFTSIAPEDWDWVQSVNLKGTFNVCQEVATVFASQESGKIVNMASATFYGGVAGLAHYVASKAGVIGLTRVLAREMGQFGVQVNAVAPGAIMTEADPSEEVIAVHGEKAKLRSLQRIGRAEDVVGPMLFFASPAADFVTGQTLIVDGGVFMS